MCWVFAFFALSVSQPQAANQSAGRWQTIPLMRNEVIAAQLNVLRECSVADRDWIVLEIENLTDKPVSIQQTWLGLDAERRDLVTDKPLGTGSLTPELYSSGSNSNPVRSGPVLRRGRALLVILGVHQRLGSKSARKCDWTLRPIGVTSNQMFAPLCSIGSILMMPVSPRSRHG